MANHLRASDFILSPEGGSLNSLSVIYEDNHLLVVDKPAGLATMGSELGTQTMARQAAEYLKYKYDKPGKVFVGVVSRLDRLVSGVLVLARTSKAASRLSEQIRMHRTEKFYLACVEGSLKPSNNVDGWSEVTHWVRKNETLKQMQTVDASMPHAQQATLRLRVLGQSGPLSLIEVQLVTGRKHQIRLQLSELGHPILGDTKYGAKRRFAQGIALHSHRLTIEHPTQKHSMTFESSPRSRWSSIPAPLLEVLRS